ncbi:MAG: hypothetical protein AAGK04_12115 [Planctomycetota bacterium]
MNHRATCVVAVCGALASAATTAHAQPIALSFTGVVSIAEPYAPIGTEISYSGGVYALEDATTSDGTPFLPFSDLGEITVGGETFPVTFASLFPFFESTDPDIGSPDISLGWNDGLNRNLTLITFARPLDGTIPEVYDLRGYGPSDVLGDPLDITSFSAVTVPAPSAGLALAIGGLVAARRRR